jgi:hypothetical protein
VGFCVGDSIGCVVVIVDRVKLGCSVPFIGIFEELVFGGFGLALDCFVVDVFVVELEAGV